MTHNKSNHKRMALIALLTMCLSFLVVDLAAQETTVGSTSSEVTAATNGGDTSSATTQTTDNESNYSVKSSFEIGVRGRDVNGNENKYRSDLNYGSGLRLFDSSLLITAKDSGGEPFDTLMITGSGWNADPNGYARISMEKYDFYRFDGSVRRMSYFNNLTNLALNQHNRNTKRNLGDFDVTLFPQRDINVRFGYSFNNQTGPVTLTYDYDRDEFPINSTFDSDSKDFRFGVDASVLGFNISFTEGYRKFYDKTDYRIDMPQLGNNPNPNSSFNTFSRLIPERGSANYHSLTIHRTFDKKVDFTGRLIYSNSKSSFDMVEMLSGRDRFGNIVVLEQSDVFGNAERPNLLGDIGVTFFVTDKFTISNTFSANSYRITGGNELFESLMRTTAGGVPLPRSTANDAVYRFTNFRRYTNTLEGSYDFNRYFSAYAGYRYTDRRVILSHIDTDLTNGSASGSSETAENKTNSLIAGLKASPVPKKWTILFDVEHGEADNAFTRLGNYDFTNLRIKNRFNPIEELSFGFSFQLKENNNPGRPNVMLPAAFVADTRSRNVSASFDWNPNAKASFSGGFTHNRVTSETSVIFPVTGASGQGVSSYRLRSNFGHVDAWVRPHNRVSFFGSYRIAKDTGSGDFFSASAFTFNGNYPISFQS
ncbi:MAG: hypothetical protein OEM82_00685, partial [Acidobacteriota bacterium]|nr:hypothetical protein [Acidobacteriota bacterium]